MPTTGAVGSSEPRGFGSHYAHDTETARPGLLRRGPHEVRRAGRAQRDHAHGLAPLQLPAHRARQRPVRRRPGEHAGALLHHPGHRRPDARGLRPDGRLLRLARPPPRLLLRALRPPVRTHRDLARRTSYPGRPPERSGSRAQRRLGEVRHDGGPERRPPGRHLLHEPRRRAAQPRGGGRREELRRGGGPGRGALGLDARPREGRRRLARRPRRLHDGALPRLPAPQRDRRRRRRLSRHGRQGAGRHRSHADGEPLAVGHLPHPEPAARAARARGVPRRGALDPGRRARRQLAAAMVARRVGDERHDGRPRHAVPGRELVRRAARRPRAGGVPRAARQRAASATGSLAGERARRHPLLRAARLHRGGNGLPAQGLRQRLPATGLGDARVRLRRWVARADGARARPPRRRPAVRPPQPRLPHAVEPAGAPVPAARARRALAPEATSGRSTRAARSSTAGSSRRTPPGSSACSEDGARRAASSIASSRTRGCCARRKPLRATAGSSIRSTSTTPRPTTPTTSPTSTPRTCTRGRASRGRRRPWCARPRRCSATVPRA